MRRAAKLLKDLAKSSEHQLQQQRFGGGHATAKDGFFPDNAPVQVNKWGSAPPGVKHNPYAPIGYEHLLRIPHAVAENPSGFRIFWWNGVPVYQNIKYHQYATALGALATFWGVTGYYEHWHDVSQGARFNTIEDVTEEHLRGKEVAGRDLVHYPTWGPFSRRAMYSKEGKKYSAEMDHHGHH